MTSWVKSVVNSNYPSPVRKNPPDGGVLCVQVVASPVSYSNYRSIHLARPYAQSCTNPLLLFMDGHEMSQIQR